MSEYSTAAISWNSVWFLIPIFHFYSYQLWEFCPYTQKLFWLFKKLFYQSVSLNSLTFWVMCFHQEETINQWMNFWKQTFRNYHLACGRIYCQSLEPFTFSRPIPTLTCPFGGVLERGKRHSLYEAEEGGVEEGKLTSVASASLREIHLGHQDSENDSFDSLCWSP